MKKTFHNTEYIGDGVYVEFDGYGVWLRTGNHDPGKCDSAIYLEPDILQSLVDFFKFHTNGKKSK